MPAVLQPQQKFSVNFSGHAVQPSRDKAFFKSIEELRYQVYCEECGFLAPDDYPEKRETDEHDANSAHFAALNEAEQLVGYVRLVFPDALQSFPFQTHCVSILDNVILPPPAQSAEISRLMVHQNYRRRLGELPPAGFPLAETPAEAPRANDQRNPSPQIMLTLYREMCVQREQQHPLLVRCHGALPGAHTRPHELRFSADWPVYRLLRPRGPLRRRSSGA